MSATPAQPHRLLVLGGTGLVGREVVTAALSNDAISAVLSFGRKPPPVDPSVAGFSKLQHTALDFEALLAEKEGGPETQKLRAADADSVVVALGTTRATAGSAENFERIDRLYVLKAAEAARTSKPQTLAYVSSGGANASSWFLYPKSKGLTEEGLARLGYSSALTFRPGVLIAPGGRQERRLAELLAVKVVPRLPFIGSSLSTATPTLGRALVKAVLSPPTTVGEETTLRDGSKLRVVSNSDISRLGAE
ncbi:Fmp52p [Rhodotorula paludigena]|uniref:Fmp52p n=1 Tax=Rhodotorula paludigena TaxID=86838 RepID=UPI00317E5F5F